MGYRFLSTEVGVPGVQPESCPLCPECDQPMVSGERLTLQVVEYRPHHDLVRLIHTECSSWYEDEDGGED